ncbi:hypothetical protein Ddc_12116 [Ditylenchus destructor]|nr:hypothetical protein Ddc_12116 [Ditylenchus destructor]
MCSLEPSLPRKVIEVEKANGESALYYFFLQSVLSVHRSFANKPRKSPKAFCFSSCLSSTTFGVKILDFFFSHNFSAAKLPYMADARLYSTYLTAAQNDTLPAPSYTL